MAANASREEILSVSTPSVPFRLLVQPIRPHAERFLECPSRFCPFYFRTNTTHAVSHQNTKRELEAVKAGHADGGGGHAYHATLQVLRSCLMRCLMRESSP